MLNVEELLQPVTGDAPAGANLEYSPEFAELERTAAGKPERQVGALVAAGEEPDWRALIAQAETLLQTTKDLRIANHLVRGLLRVDGFGGLADGLQLLRGLIERYWATLHPQIEADGEENDPTFRVNAMAALTHRDILQAIRAAPLVGVRGIGAVTLREIDATFPQDQPSSPNTATIEAAFQQVPLPVLAEASRVVQRCCDEARGLADSWGTRVDSRGPDFTEFRRVLAQASEILKTRLEWRQPTPNGPDATPERAAAPSIASGPLVRGDLRSREEVIRALDAICAYYARHEPSSPVPLLLERSKRLATMSFLDIVKDMLPEGISTIQTVVGKTKD